MSVVHSFVQSYRIRQHRVYDLEELESNPELLFQVPVIQPVAEVTNSPSLTSSTVIPTSLWTINPSDEIVFSKNSQGDLAAKVQIKNISAKTIAFKVLINCSILQFFSVCSRL